MAVRTADTFKESSAVVQKIFQPGRHLLDSDLNEQTDVFRNYNERLLAGLLTNTDQRFADGFLVEAHSNPRTVTIKAGFAGFIIDDNRAVLLRLNEDMVLATFQSWVSYGAARTDYIYIDVWKEEVTSQEDIQVVNSTLGEETAVDIRLKHTIAISTGAVPGDPPAGYTRHLIASVTKTEDSDYIVDEEIAMMLPDYSRNILSEVEVPIWTLSTVHFDDGSAVDLDDPSQQFRVLSTGAQTSKSVIKIAFFLPSPVTYIALHANCWRDDDAAFAFVRLNGFVFGGVQTWVPNIKTELKAYMPVSSPTGALYELWVDLTVKGPNTYVYMEKPIITAGFGSFTLETYQDV